MTIRYLHRQLITVLTVAAMVFIFLATTDSNAGQENTLDKTVQHLITYVAQSDLTFLRNSGQYTSKEAAEHMRKKYEHFRDKIETPEDFIRLCATRSIISGKFYMIINEQGKKIRTSEWLTVELMEHRHNTTGESL